MLELAAAICAGGAAAMAVLCVALPGPLTQATGWSLPHRLANRVWLGESALAASTAWPWLDGRLLLAAEACAGLVGTAAAILLTGLPALGVAAFAGSIALVRVTAASRSHRLRRERQDAVLEAVRMLRQLLETGAGTVQQAIAILAERGPVPLRKEFRLIAATSLGKRQAWATARDRVAEPLFDMLAAAVLIQGPGGGELAPLFAELEGTVTSAQEVARGGGASGASPFGGGDHRLAAGRLSAGPLDLSLALPGRVSCLARPAVPPGDARRHGCLLFLDAAPSPPRGAAARKAERCLSLCSRAGPSPRG